jgi:hypothetical protein
LKNLQKLRRNPTVTQKDDDSSQVDLTAAAGSADAEAVSNCPSLVLFTHKYRVRLLSTRRGMADPHASFLELLCCSLISLFSFFILAHRRMTVRKRE